MRTPQQIASYLLKRDNYFYEPVKSCIYCGAEKYSETRDKLGDEHIIPLSLGGKLILPEASCLKCEKITSYLDGFIAKKLLRMPRDALSLPSRRPKDRPKTLPLQMRRGRDATIEEIALHDYPILISLPKFERPGFARGVLPSENFPETEIITSLHYPQATPYTFTDGAEHEILYAPANLCRFLAKIALSYAVAEIGLNNFIPKIAPLILGQVYLASFYVGSLSEEGPTDSHNMHRIGTRQIICGNKPHQTVEIQLFSFLSVPIVYQVIVGEHVQRINENTKI